MLEEFSQRVLALEGANDSIEVLRALERSVHTIKGDSMALGFDALAKLAHRLEDYFRGLRESPVLERQAIDLVLACGDTMLCSRGLLRRAPETDPSIDASARLAPSIEPSTKEMAMEPLRGRSYRLIAWFAKLTAWRPRAFVRQRFEARTNSKRQPDLRVPEIETAPQWVVELEATSGKDEIRRAARVPGVTSRVMLREQKRLLPRTAVEPAPADTEEEGSFARTPGSSTSAASDQLRVEVSKIDRIMNLVGELVIGRSMVTQALSEFSSGDAHGTAADRLSDANGFLERTMTELQAAVLQIRMVPVDNIPTVPVWCVTSPIRGKRRTSTSRGLTGARQEHRRCPGRAALHLVRTPSTTVRARGAELGKGSRGEAEARRVLRRNHAHVVVEDDGRGIDLARVGERAVAGLIETSQLDAMTPPTS
jgi:two-component system chemotaxis sensor kinase CheA